MKNRIRKVVNFFAFNLLFFALYLNFIHRDRPNVVFSSAPTRVVNADAISGAVLVKDPENYLNRKEINSAANNNKEAQNSDAVKPEESAAMRLSMN